MKKYDEKKMLEAIKPAYEWAKQNLNPHQEIVITLDGALIKSDELGIPSKSMEEI